MSLDGILMGTVVRRVLVAAGMMASAIAPVGISAQDSKTRAPAAVERDSATRLAPVTVRKKQVRPSRDALSREEIARKPAANLYDVVMTLRSNWMRGPATVRSSIGLSGGGGMMAAPIPGTVVYVDGRALGPLTTLRTIPAEDAEKLCYYSLNKAQSRFGLRVQAPVLEVFSRGSTMGNDAC